MIYDAQKPVFFKVSIKGPNHYLHRKPVTSIDGQPNCVQNDNHKKHAFTCLSCYHSTSNECIWSICVYSHVLNIVEDPRHCVYFIGPDLLNIANAFDYLLPTTSASSTLSTLSTTSYIYYFILPLK